MSEPRTEAGRALLNDAGWTLSDPLGRLPFKSMKEAIVRVEAEAVATYLASPEAERALAEALGAGDPDTRGYIKEAKRILAAWRKALK